MNCLGPSRLEFRSASNRLLAARLRRVAAITAALALLLPAIYGASARAADSSRRPNIILCMADDQGWGDVGYNGHPRLKTPVLDEMASTGLRFDRFYAAAPVCSPTRGSVLTGRHPNRFGCFSWGYEIRPQELTIAEALKTAGYTTGHFGKWHLGSVRADAPTSPGASGFDQWLSSPNFFENSPLMSQNGKVVSTQGEGSQVIVDAALEFIADASRQKQPFLTVIWFGSPHLPYEALPEDRQAYKDQPANLQHYYGEITAMDRSLGRLRTRLKELGVADDTLLWYTSDNGATGAGSTGGLRGKKASLWEGGIRVPTVIEWPAVIKSPAVCDLACGSVDIFPTVLEIAGAKPKDSSRPLDGASLAAVLHGKKTGRDKPLGFWVYPQPGRPVRSGDLLRQLQQEQTGAQQPAEAPKSNPSAPGQISTAAADRFSDEQLPGHSAWIDGALKLHRIADQKGQIVYRLYDLSTDRTESHDLAARQPEQVEKMKQALEAWQKSVIQSLNGDDYPPR